MAPYNRACPSRRGRGRNNCTRGAELAFHNRDHVHDVLTGLHCLCRHLAEPLPLTDLAALLVAMIGHDFGHSGCANRTPRELEKIAWHRTSHFVETTQPLWQRRVAHIILSTDPADYARLARPLSTAAQRRAQLAVEADLFASLLPLRGFYLGSRLADEILPSNPDLAERLRTLEGRLAFLKTCKPHSSAAIRLGLADIVTAQIRVIQSLTPPERSRSWSPEWGEDFAARVSTIL